MSDYTKTVDFAAKDTLNTGDANKLGKGTEVDTEFNNIATAVATKEDTPSLTSSTTYIAGDMTLEASTSTSYVKLKEIFVGHAGTVKTSFNLYRAGTPTGTAYGKIYVDGTGTGTEQSTSGSETIVTEDIAVTAGQLVQVYVKHSTGSNGTGVKNFKIGCTGALGVYVTPTDL